MTKVRGWRDVGPQAKECRHLQKQKQKDTFFPGASARNQACDTLILAQETWVRPLISDLQTVR